MRDLIGFEVRAGGRVLGPVRDIIPGPANDSLSVAGPAGQVLVPFTFDAVTDIDHDDGVIILREDLLGEWAWGEGE